MDTQVDDQALSVLRFMERNAPHRPLFRELLGQDIERWPNMTPHEKATVFDRNARRFRTVCPTLSQKDRVRDASEALRWAVAWSTMNAG